MIAQLALHLFRYIIFSVKSLSSTTKASHQLLHKFFEKLPASKEQHATDAIEVVISIVFHSVNQLCACAKEHAESTINDSKKKVQEALIKFLNKSYGSTANLIFDSPREILVFLLLHIILSRTNCTLKFSSSNHYFNLTVRQSSKPSGRMK